MAGNSDPIYIAKCPPLVAYTQAEREQAGAEIKAMPREAVTPRMIADYVTLRDQCRALKK